MVTPFLMFLEKRENIASYYYFKLFLSPDLELWDFGIRFVRSITPTHTIQIQGEVG